MDKNVALLDKVNNKDECNKIVLYGLLLRFALLVFMLTIAKLFTEPYIIADDIKYEDTVQYYITYASSFFDFGRLKIVADSYIAPFWPWVSCIIGYIFKSIYAGRFLNIILSALSVKLIYEIVYILSDKHKTAMFAAKLFAFMPISVITACFPIKDIFITFAVLYVFYIFLSLQKNKKIGFVKVVFLVLLMISIYYSRGAVMELLCVFFFCFYIKKYIDEKKYWTVIFLTIISLAILYVFRGAILGSFDTKLESYGGGGVEGGFIEYIKLNSIMDFYKAPFAYFFANIQPMKLQLFGESNMSFWYNVLTYANISIYPVAFANLFYMFEKKHNTMFWGLTFIMYIAVISLSIGIFRHYLFLLPLQMINCALYFEDDTKKRVNKTMMVIFCSLGLFLIILIYTAVLTF